MGWETRFQNNDPSYLEPRITNAESSLAQKATKTFVTYKDFGAVLDGVTDDTAKIKACHDYANANNLKVVQNSGTIFITGLITVQTSTDLSGCSIIIKGNCNNQTLYQITSKNPIQSVTGFTQSELSQGARVFPSLSNYKHNYIQINSDQVLTNRIDSGVTTVLKKDSLVLTRGGGSTTQLLTDFTSGNLTITAQKIDTSNLVFEGLEIVWNFQNANDSCCVVDLQRSNSTIKNISLTIPNTIDYGVGAKGQVIFIRNCCKIAIENIIGENITDGTSNSGYIFNIDTVIDIQMRRVMALKGWGCTGTNNVKNWSVYDSDINRIDTHIGTGDIYCNNVRFVGGWGVTLGYGLGVVTLENCTSDIENYDGKNLQSVVYLGPTYGLKYQGDIVIKNHTIIPNTTTVINLLSCDAGTDSSNYNVTQDIKMPNLFVDGLRIRSTNCQVTGYYIRHLSYMYTTLNTMSKNMYLPNNIQIRNVNFDTKGDSVSFTAFSMSELASSVTPYVYGTVNIELAGIHQGVYSKYMTGFASATIASDMYKKHLIDITDQMTDTTKVSFDINIDNCDGGLYSACLTNRINVTNSKLHHMIVEGDIQARSCSDYRISNSTIYFCATSNNVNTYIQAPCSNFTNNVFNLIQIDGVYKPILNSTWNTVKFKRLLGNLFVQSTDSTNANQYWKYVDSGSFTVPTTL